jgi:hypothetical protein
VRTPRARVHIGETREEAVALLGGVDVGQQPVDECVDAGGAGAA